MARPRLVDTARAGLSLEPALLVRIHEVMVKARVLEERLIQMYRQGDGYFWIGGPGEEAFNVPLGLLIRKGQGLDRDYLHFHYRQSGTLLAMGMDPVDALRQMKSTATDPFSGGRNFAGHYSVREWNVCPVTSPIEVQYAIAPGTALAQKRHGGDAITIVTGGDAGTAEGDFATGLLWSTRPGNELPILFLVTNNGWGISTAAGTQHAAQIADRGRAFGMPSRVIDGTDPEVSYLALQEAMAYVRRERRPYLLEATVSRLYGHSSASGANLDREHLDPLERFEERLDGAGVITRDEARALRHRLSSELAAAARRVRDEPQPSPASIWDHVYSK
jgi:2-oxoisovalerate dehydrogenase E1 component alpha subunit